MVEQAVVGPAVAEVLAALTADLTATDRHPFSPAVSEGSGRDRRLHELGIATRPTLPTEPARRASKNDGVEEVISSDVDIPMPILALDFRSFLGATKGGGAGS